MSKPVELDVTERFGVGALDDIELCFFLFERYSYSSLSPSSGEQSVLFCPEQFSDWVIKLIYRKKGLEKVLTRLGEAEIVKLEDQIKRDLLSPTVQSIERVFMFASIPVEGFFSVADQFQLFPPPSNAPKPPSPLGPNPFVCEISVSSSNVPSLRMFRRTVRIQEIGLLLNLLLEFGIRFPPVMQGLTWVTRKSSCKGERSVSEFCVEGYSVEGFSVVAEKFSDARGWSPLEEVAPEVYYHQLGIDLGKPTLKVATDTRELAGKYFSLEETKKKKFLRALFWFYQSDKKIASSESIAYIALINAIETLLPDEPVEKCPECQRPLNSISTSFLKFLKEYAPVESQFEDGRRSLLYNMRSRLTHGQSLFSSDLGVSLLWNPADVANWKSFETASTLTRLALIEWLRKA
jgi:hypothetical protein